MAVGVIGSFIVTDAEALVPENEPLPVPVQLSIWKPSDGVALMPTTALLFCQPLAGLTLPPAPAFIVRKNCRVKFAVYVVDEGGGTGAGSGPRARPQIPQVWTAGAPLLGGGGRDGVDRALRPTEHLSVRVVYTIHCERTSRRIGLHCHADGLRKKIESERAV